MIIAKNAIVTNIAIIVAMTYGVGPQHNAATVAPNAASIAGMFNRPPCG